MWCACADVLQLSGVTGSVRQFCVCTLDERTCRSCCKQGVDLLILAYIIAFHRLICLTVFIALWHMLIKVHSLSFTILTWNWWCLFLHVCMTGVHQGPLLASTLLCLGTPYLPLGLSSYIISSATTSFVGLTPGRDSCLEYLGLITIPTG